MKRQTYLSNALSVADYKAKYDAEVKKILAAKVILAWIMKFSVEEFKDYPIEEISMKQNKLYGESQGTDLHGLLTTILGKHWKI